MGSVDLVDIGTLIERRPDYRGGRPHIAGTGISVARVGILWGEGLSPTEIVDEVFRGALTAPQVYAAIAYYLANRTAIDADIEANDAAIDRRAASA